MEIKKHIEIAQFEIGKTELPIGSNWGEHVKKYLNSVNINTPASWCMAFVYWCCCEAYKNNNLLFKTGGVLFCWQKVDAKYKFKTPQPGDIFIMDFGKGLGHTGFVESLNGNDMVTIEGNATTISGSREGIEVCRKTTRKASQCIGFIRIS